MKLRLVTLSLLASLLVGVPALAQSPPDFSGTWELNTDKGKNLGMVKAVDETVVVKKTPAKMIIDFALDVHDEDHEAPGELRPHGQTRPQ